MEIVVQKAISSQGSTGRKIDRKTQPLPPKLEDPDQLLKQMNKVAVDLLKHFSYGSESWNRWLVKKKEESRFERLKRAYLSGDVAVGPLGHFVETELCSVHHCYHDVSLHRQDHRPCPGSVQAKHFSLPRPMALMGNKPTGGSEDTDKLDAFLRKHIETDLQLHYEFASSCCDQSDPVPFVTGQSVQKDTVSEQQTEHGHPKPLIRVLTSNVCLTRSEPESPVKAPAEKLRRENPELFEKLVDQVASEFCESSFKRWKDVLQFPLDTKPSRHSKQQKTRKVSLQQLTTSYKKTSVDVKQSTASCRIESNTGKLFQQLKDNVGKMQDMSRNFVPEVTVSKEELEPSTSSVSSGELIAMMKEKLQQLQESSLLKRKELVIPALQSELSESKPSCTDTGKVPSHLNVKKESKTEKLFGQLQENIQKMKGMVISEEVLGNTDLETPKPAVTPSASSGELFEMLKQRFEHLQECTSGSNKKPELFRDTSLKHKEGCQRSDMKLQQPSLKSCYQKISTASSVHKNQWQPKPRKPFGQLWQPSSGQSCKDRRDRKLRKKQTGCQPSCQKFSRSFRDQKGNTQCFRNQEPKEWKSCKSGEASRQPKKKLSTCVSQQPDSLTEKVERNDDHNGMAVTKSSVSVPIPWADRPIDESLDDLPMPQWESDEESTE